MFSNLTGWHALIILAVVVLLFGATRLPALAKAVGQSTKIFKSELSTPSDDASRENASAQTATVSSDLTSSAQHPQP